MAAAKSQDEVEMKNYFALHISLLKWSGIRLEPFAENTSFTRKILIVVACVTFVLAFPLLYVIDEAFETPNLELEDMTFNLSYCITHSLGECSKKMRASEIHQQFSFLGTLKILIFTYKRKQIWKFCQILETGRMKPSMKRGGKVEFEYVKNAIYFANFQV